MSEVLKMTFADQWRPRVQASARLYDLMLVLGGSWLIALLAQVALPLPFTPVPVTGQSLAVLLVGMSLGAWRGAASVAAYLAQSALGAPFLAGAKAGTAVMLGATGGYLIGFLLAAWLVGRLAERNWDRSFAWTALAMLSAKAVIFSCGLAWLAAFVPKGSLLNLGLWPFLPGALVKIALAMLLLPTAWRFVRR